MRGKKRSKDKQLLIHARRRLRERFGLYLHPNHLVQRILEGDAQFLEKQSNRVTVWRVLHNDTPIICFYDKSRKRLVTVITQDMYDEGERDE